MYSNIKKSPNNPLIIRSLRAIQSQKLTIQHLSLKFYQKSFAMSQKNRTFAPDFLREFQDHKIFTHNILIIFKKSKSSFNMKFFKKKLSAKSILILALFAVISSFWNYVDAKYTLTTSRSIPASANSKKWGQESNVWYIYHGGFAADGSKSLSEDATPSSWSMSESDIYCPNAISYADIDYYAEESWALVTGRVSFYLNANNARKFTSELLAWTGDGTTIFNPKYKHYYENNVQVDPYTNNLSIGWLSGFSSGQTWKHCTKKTMDVKIKVPYHMDSYDSWNNITSYVFASIQHNSDDDYSTWDIDLSEYYKSYYTKSGITFEITGANAGMFSVPSSPIAAGSIYANGADCFGNASETIGSAPTITVKYQPTEIGTHTATLNIKLDGNVVKSILLNGTCYGKYYISMDFDINDLNTATYQMPLADAVSVKDRSGNTIDTEVSFAVESATTADYSFDNVNKLLTLRTVGDFVMTATATYQGPEDEEAENIVATVKTVVGRGTLEFRNNSEDDDWFNPNNWYPHNQAANESERVIPSAANYNVSIQNKCIIDNTGAECWNFEITSDGTLEIATTGALNVANNAINPQSQASQLILKASETAQGTMLFHNTTTAAPFAEAEMYVPLTGVNKKLIWQYRGVPVINGTLEGDGTTLVYQWSEPAGAEEDAETWYEIGDKSMSCWYGYAVSKVGGDSICKVQGQLVNTNKQYLLDYSDESHPNKGYNLITNSYSAPMLTNKMSTSDFSGAPATVYLYNTGTYDEWRQSGNNGSLTSGSAPGQFTSYSINSTSYEIPSGESFFVLANAPNGYFDMNYGMTNASPSGAFKAPRKIEHFNGLGIIVEGKESGDKVVLLESENCSSEFDNGYDGIKLTGAKGTPQLYAANDFGHTSLNVDRTFMGQEIGFAAGSNGEKYTISFLTDELEGYSKLYLYDKNTGVYTNILEGETYTFTGKVSGEERRFIILGERENGEILTGSDKRIEIIGDRAFVCGFDGGEESVTISDMSGRIVWQSSSAAGPWFDIPEGLASGVYVISVGDCQTKFIR